MENIIAKVNESLGADTLAFAKHENSFMIFKIGDVPHFFDSYGELGLVERVLSGLKKFELNEKEFIIVKKHFDNAVNSLDKDLDGDTIYELLKIYSSVGNDIQCNICDFLDSIFTMNCHVPKRSEIKEFTNFYKTCDFKKLSAFKTDEPKLKKALAQSMDINNFAYSTILTRKFG